MRTDLVRLARHTVTYGAGSVVMRFLSVLLLPLFTAYLTPADYGISAMLGLIAFVITPVFGLGIGAVLGIFYYRSDEAGERATVVWTAFAVLLASAAVLVAAGFWFAPEISQAAFRTGAHARLVALSLAGAACTIMVTPFSLFFQFDNRARSYVVITTASAAIGLVTALFLVIVLRRGVNGLIEGTTLGQFATLLLFLVPCARALRPRFRWATVREMLRVGVAFVPSFIWLFVIQHGNKYLLERTSGVADLGIYTIGFNIGMAMTIAVGGFQNAWMPYFMSYVKKREEGERVFGRVASYYLLGFGLLTLLFFFAARPAILILTRPAFHEAYLVVGCAAAAQFFSGLFSIVLPAMYFENDVQYVSVLQAVVAVLSVGLNFVLITAFGVIGAAVGLALGSLLLPVAQHIWNVTHRGYIRPRYEWRRIGWYALAFTFLAGAFMSVRTLPLVTEIALAAIGLAAALGVTLALLTAGERGALGDMRRQAVAALRTIRTRPLPTETES